MESVPEEDGRLTETPAHTEAVGGKLTPAIVEKELERIARGTNVDLKVLIRGQATSNIWVHGWPRAVFIQAVLNLKTDARAHRFYSTVAGRLSLFGVSLSVGGMELAARRGDEHLTKMSTQASWPASSRAAREQLLSLARRVVEQVRDDMENSK